MTYILLNGGQGGGGGASADSPFDVDNLRLEGNTITTTNASGNLVLDTDASGLVQVLSSMQFVDAGLTVYSGGSGGDEKVQLAGGAGGPLFSSDTDLRWYNNTDISSGSADAGLKRLAAGKLQGTDGGAGGLTAFMLTATVGIFRGAGTPEGSVTADIGSIYLRTDGGVGSSLYVKEEDSGTSTGWQAK